MERRITILDQIEQKLNSVTHGIGTGMSIVGMILLIVLGLRAGNPWITTSFTIYGAFQILLYLSSTLTHVFHDMPRAHSVLRVLDQASVYLLIAGTYTPIALIVLRGSGGWWMFGIEWGLAVAGILMKSLIFRKPHIASDLLYLPMGWLIVFFVAPLSRLAEGGLLMWIFIGGGCYSIGIIFYIIKKLPFGHVIWHLFVLAGGISFYLGFILHLI